MSRSSNFLVSALQNAQAIRKILQAFLRGGWKAAALETVKRYWPYILCGSRTYFAADNNSGVSAVGYAKSNI